MSDETLVPQQEDSAEQNFDDAFAEFSGNDPVADPVDTDNSEEQADTAGVTEEQGATSQESQDDPLAGLPESTKKYVLELQRQKDEAEHAAKSQIGRVSALTRKLNEMSSKPAVEATQETPLPGDSEWDEFKNDYPQIASQVEKRMDAVNKLLNEKVGQATQPIRELQHQQFLNGQFAALQAAHPDFQEVAVSSQFRSWLSAQPPTIQALITSEDASDASYLLSTYKAIAGRANTPSGPSRVEAIKAQRQQKLQQSAGVTARQAANPSVGGAPDDFDAAFEYFSRKGSR
jgi:hypothetical protein